MNSNNNKNYTHLKDGNNNDKIIKIKNKSYAFPSIDKDKKVPLMHIVNYSTNNNISVKRNNIINVLYRGQFDSVYGYERKGNYHKICLIWNTLILLTTFISINICI